MLSFLNEGTIKTRGRKNDGMDDVIQKVRYQIFRLHENLKRNQDVQAELDRYVFVWHMIKNKHPMLTEQNIDVFILKECDVFGVSHLPDLGRDIRSIFDSSKDRTFVMNLIDYSMPYIKHNRLSLPPITQITHGELSGLMKIILGCLVGIYPHCNRRPTWEIRVRIFVRFHDLCSSGKKRSLYEFCQNNIALLRVSIIEYCIYFISTNLPIELQCNENLFESRWAMNFVFDSIYFNVDNFRQLALQKQCDWKSINECAIVAVERLNRVCKGKLTRVIRKTARHDGFVKNTGVANIINRYGDGFVEMAFNLPRFANVQYARSLIGKSFSFELLRDISVVTSVVSTIALPANLKNAQIEAYRNYITANGPLATQCAIVSFCVKCASMRQKSTSILSMRCGSNDVVSCGLCKCTQHIIKVNMLGRIVKIFEKYFFFCPICFNVHEWQNDGREFSNCDAAWKFSETMCAKNCCLCQKQFAEILPVFDDRLGIIQHVRLCKWHCPDESNYPFMYNLECLWNFVREKIKTKRARVSCSY